MKLAISGKGGSGKSTLAAAIILLMARRDRKFLAVDADRMIYFVVSKTS